MTPYSGTYTDYSEDILFSEYQSEVRNINKRKELEIQNLQERLGQKYGKYVGVPYLKSTIGIIRVDTIRYTGSNIVYEGKKFWMKKGKLIATKGYPRARLYEDTATPYTNFTEVIED